MNRWNQLKNEYGSTGPVYQNVQTLKSEMDRLNEICGSSKKDSARRQHNALGRHQEMLENALADLELTGQRVHNRQLNNSANSSSTLPSMGSFDSTNSMPMPFSLPLRQADINGNEYYSDAKPNSSQVANLMTPAHRGPLAASIYENYHHSSAHPFEDYSLYANVRSGGSVGLSEIDNRITDFGQAQTRQQAPQPSPQASSAQVNRSQHVTLVDNPQHSPIHHNLQHNQPQPTYGNLPANHPSNLPSKAPIVVNHHAPSNNNYRNRSQAEQVDHLTDLLVKSMESSNEPDFFGMCNKCGEKVVGEGSGCTAMEMVYHIQCFTCTDCQKELRGKSFYALENNPFCEDCYLNTLEKCCVCEKPILDRILRATGKPYHPSCFTCVICRKSLDGIPFTVDATNQVHCIDCFHEKFAPRCSVCKEPIIPEQGKTETVRVVALDRSFHVACYKCEDCDLLLSSDSEGRGCYPLDDHILCRNCNAKRVQAITA